MEQPAPVPLLRGVADPVMGGMRLSIKEAFAGATVFVTGGSGYIGGCVFFSAARREQRDALRGSRGSGWPESVGRASSGLPLSLPARIRIAPAWPDGAACASRRRCHAGRTRRTGQNPPRRGARRACAKTRRQRPPVVGLL